MTDETLQLRPVGLVDSLLTDLGTAPKQGDEGAPDAWIVLDPTVVIAARDLAPGDEAFVLTWLHLADRDLLAVHPRDDPSRPLTGVFATRSQDRPNPIGLHLVRIIAVEADRIRVGDLEAVNGTPVLDIKPVIDARSVR